MLELALIVAATLCFAAAEVYLGWRNERLKDQGRREAFNRTPKD